MLEFGEPHGQLVQVPDGRVVLVHDRRYPYQHAHTRARISNDEGRTWEPEIYHVSDGMGYPASVALPDGTVVTITGNTKLDASFRPIGKWRVQAMERIFSKTVKPTCFGNFTNERRSLFTFLTSKG